MGGGSKIEGSASICRFHRQQDAAKIGCWRYLSRGGFLNSVEEDRELRNRTIAAGCVYAYVDRPLLTKVEMAVSLTTDAETGYAGRRRRADRQHVWDRKNQWLRAGLGAPVAEDPVVIDLGGLVLEDVHNPDVLALNTGVPATEATWEALAPALPDAAPAFEAV